MSFRGPSAMPLVARPLVSRAHAPLRPCCSHAYPCPFSGSCLPSLAGSRLHACPVFLPLLSWLALLVALSPRHRALLVVLSLHHCAVARPRAPRTLFASSGRSRALTTPSLSRRVTSRPRIRTPSCLCTCVPLHSHTPHALFASSCPSSRLTSSSCLSVPRRAVTPLVPLPHRRLRAPLGLRTPVALSRPSRPCRAVVAPLALSLPLRRLRRRWAVAPTPLLRTPHTSYTPPSRATCPRCLHAPRRAPTRCRLARRAAFAPVAPLALSRPYAPSSWPPCPLLLSCHRTFARLSWRPHALVSPPMRRLLAPYAPPSRPLCCCLAPCAAVTPRTAVATPSLAVAPRCAAVAPSVPPSFAYAPTPRSPSPLSPTPAPLSRPYAPSSRPYAPPSRPLCRCRTSCCCRAFVPLARPSHPSHRCAGRAPVPASRPYALLSRPSLRLPPFALLRRRRMSPPAPSCLGSSCTRTVMPS
ncbi:hypothetical protein DENSPDRAFT_886255 [Dentipellis sp. KUC8613]|nr:hypothetical protein DENSPDRAFT_886255 [Dentipellis sp. KUC8613]